MRIERIPPLLRKRIDELKGTEFEIPEAALGLQAVYDRVLVWQFPDARIGKSTYGEGPIIKPDFVATRITQSIPRGLIVTAGLGCMDALRSNGMDIGHVVYFCVNSPYRLPLDDRDENFLCLLRAGDMVASEDLAKALDNGECFVSENGGEHTLATLGPDGVERQWAPKLPWMEE